jgi:hypothetical protein
MDVAQAQETMAVVNDKIADLEARLQNDVDLLDAAYDPGSEPLEEVRLNPRSTDIALRIFGLLWLPYRKDAGGRMVPDWS